MAEFSLNIYPNLASVSAEEIAQNFSQVDAIYRSLVIDSELSGLFFTTIKNDDELYEIFSEVGITKKLHQKKLKMKLDSLNSWLYYQFSVFSSQYFPSK